MGSINLKHTGSGSDIALSSDGTSLLLNGTAVGGGSANAIATTTVPVAGQTNTGTLAIGNNVLTSVNANKSSNIGIGNGALELATDSRTTVAVGGSALKSNGTTAFGWQNTAIGVSAGLNVTGGYDQVFMGYNCGGAIASGTGNIVIGSEAYLNKTGTNFQYNVVIGHKAGWGSTSGSNAPQGQVLIGQRAGSYCQGGVIAIGDYAVVSGTLGGASVAIGKSALRYGGNFRNVAIGDSALLYADTTSQQNVGIGYYALKDLTSGDNNTGVGNDVLQNITTGSYNTCVGDSAGINQTTPSSNTFIGKSSGSSVTTGGSNTILGRFNGNQGGVDIRTASNNIVLANGDGVPRMHFNGGKEFMIPQNANAGYFTAISTDPVNSIGDMNRSAMPSAAYARIVLQERAGKWISFVNGTPVHYGTISVSGSGVSYGSNSDHRLKENITNLTNATDRLKQLSPKRFNFINNPTVTTDGFLAHEVQDIVPEAVTGTFNGSETFGNVVDADGVIVQENVNSDFEISEGQTFVEVKVEPMYQQIDQSKLVPLLVKTIQELEARITALES